MKAVPKHRISHMALFLVITVLFNAAVSEMKLPQLVRITKRNERLILKASLPQMGYSLWISLLRSKFILLDRQIQDHDGHHPQHVLGQK
jgi:hypothetical protein